MTNPGPEAASAGGAPQGAPGEPVTVTDRRRVDPETGEVRPESAGPASASGEGDSAQGNAAPAEVPTAPENDEVAELTAALQRERAQFANFKRRAAEEQQGSVAYGKRVLIEKLLPLIDDLDRARAHGDLEEGPMRTLADKLTGVLITEGLAAFGAPGDVFDPELHEAVQHDGSGAEPVLGDVYRRGYRVGDKVIRTAMVTVTDPVPGTATPNGAQ